MNSGIKKLLSTLFIILSIGAVILIAFSNSELANAWEAICSLDLLWLAGLLLCWFLYVFPDSLGIWVFLRRHQFPLHFGRSFCITLISFYYSNITPGATGGQPMQVSYLRKAGIPVGYGTTAVTIRLIANQFAVSLLSLLLLILRHDFVTQQLNGAIWAVRIGWVINFSVIPLVVLAAFRRNWIQRFLFAVIRLLERMRLVRHPEHLRDKVSDVLDTYHHTLTELLRTPSQLILQLLFSAVSMIGLTGSVIFVYHALGMSGTSWPDLLAISSLLFISASYTPLPGASGAQEGGFLLYYRGIFSDGTIGLALLIWRFFTYYLFLIVGALALIAEKMLYRHSHRKKTPAGENL